MRDACKRYIPLVPPFHKAPAEFSPAEARAYFDWYLSHLDGRCEYLKELVYQTSDLAEGTLDCTLESLRPLWAWFLPRARIVWRREARLLRDVLRTGALEPKFARDIFKPWRRTLSTKTEYLIRDIGMYVGKTFVAQYPQRLSWTYRSAPQSDIFVNTPLLTGFVQTEDMRGNALPQPFHPEFEPIHMTGVQAVKILHGRQANEDLYRICLLWSGWIPGDGDRGQPRA